MANPANGKHAFLDPQVLARLAAQGLHARLPMLGSVSGKHRSPVRGSSLEFAQYRKYVPGDDMRRLDWRAWGRSDRFYTKEYEADTNLRLCVIVDTSGSLNFKVNGVSKFDQMKSLAGTLAYLTSRQGDAVGLYCTGERFLDMEGGEPITADPNIIGRQYKQAMAGYIDDVGDVMREAAVDYHRAGLSDPVDEVLARFLLRRQPKKGAK